MSMEKVIASNHYNLTGNLCEKASNRLPSWRVSGVRFKYYH